MPEPLQGYWNIYQCVHLCELAAREVRADVDLVKRGGPFGGANAGTPPADVLRRALESGELLAAGMVKATGALVTIEARMWRLEFRRHVEIRKPAHFASWRDDYPPGSKPWPPMQTCFAAAYAGETIPRALGQSALGQGWVYPMVAQADLARWFGEDPPREPLERPADWPTPIPPRPATLEQLEWFVMGYAVRAVENGKPATRDEVREAVSKENMGTAREADSAHAALPARLKNPDRSKGSNRAK